MDSSKRAIALSERFESVYAVIGWHPNEAHLAAPDLRPQLLELAQHPKVVAIGETGIDYYRLPEPGAAETTDREVLKQKQAELFQLHLDVAAETGLNCVIHQRHAFDDTLAILQKYKGKVRPVFHCFVDEVSAIEKLIPLDCLFSFTGIITFKNAAAVRETLAAVSLDRLMLETDCPFLAPVPYRGKRGEPAYVKIIAETVCSVKKCSLEELSQATCTNARAFFKKMK